MRATAILFGIACALLAGTALGQKSVTDEVGFNPEKLYDFHDIDSVNLFNGNLTVTLPLGQRYRVGANLSYQFMLIYNGKTMEIESYVEIHDEDDVRVLSRGIPARQSNAGVGWRVSLGRLLPPYHPARTNSSFSRYSYIYEGPAGDEHEFPTSDHDAVTLSSDPQPLRLSRVIGLSLPTREVEMPNGEIHRFQEEEGDWRLKQIRDRFGNQVNISYTYALIDGKKRESTWTVTDSIGRSHTVLFLHHADMRESWSLGQSVASMTLDGHQGADNTYVFNYASAGGTLTSELRSVSRPAPDPAPYTFTYGGSWFSLSSVTLPTGASLSYTYQPYHFASETDVCANGVFGAAGVIDGIKTRTISDSVTSHTWEYVQRRGPQVPVDYVTPQPCWPYPSPPPPYPYERGPFYWSRTSVLAPVDAANERVRTDHYFNIFGEPPYPDTNSHPFPAANALPFGYAGVAARPPDARAKGPVTDVPEDIAGYPADVSASDGSGAGRYLASRIYEGCDAAGDCTNGTLLRSTYVQYDCLDVGVVDSPNKCWTVSSRTVHETDQGCGGRCYTEETSSDRTGAGLHRTVTAKSNFPTPGATCSSSCPERLISTSYTDFPLWTAAERPNLSKPWIAGTYTEKRYTEGSDTIRSMYKFSSTGLLQGARALKGAQPGGDDVLRIFNHDSKGNVVQEKLYGGDGANLGTTMCCETPGAGLRYLLKRTYDAHNYLTREEYLRPTSTCTDATNPACQSVLTTADLTTDKFTGLPVATRDSAGVETAYTYDAIGRLATVASPGAATRGYTYVAATSSSNARVTEVVSDAGGATISIRTFELDGMGRVLRTSSSLPNGKVAAVQVEYDEQGRRKRVSQPVERSSHPTASIGTFWTSYTYDAFGRQTAVTTPDHTAASPRIASFDYAGARRAARTVSVATSATGSTAETTVEHYDPLGRLIRVEENAANTSAASTRGSVVATTYTYDAGGRLKTVTMNDGTATQQVRSFVYDGRGFLTRESHPEQVGDTIYSEYDPLGQPGKRALGAGTVAFTYDPAGRVTKVADVAGSTEKVLKTFSYATTNDETNLRRGKVSEAVRHNDLPFAGTIQVKETYTYGTPNGRLSQIETNVDRVVGGAPSSMQKFTQQVQYDELQQPSVVTMPTCSVHGCSAAGGLATVGYERTSGFLTSVPGFAALTYAPSGMVQTVVHASSPASTDTYSSASGLPRPSAIAFSGGSACPAPAASTISAADTVCPGSGGHQASVPARANITHTWTISGGTLTSAATGNSVTFTAGSTGGVTLTVTATDNLCGGMAASSKVVTLAPAPTSSPITAPGSVCGSATGVTASVAARSGITHTWAVTNGTITSSTTGNSIAFTAGPSGNVTLSVTAGNACGLAATTSKSVAVNARPTATLSGATTIVRGESTRIDATLTGAAPWNLTWSDAHIETTVTDSTPFRVVSPAQTTTYHVTPSWGSCGGAASNAVTVTVQPPAPSSVAATTLANRQVRISWPAVAGAAAYRIERTTRVGAATNWQTTTTATLFDDVVPASVAPVTYIYYVRAIDASGEVSDRGPWDHATAATALYAQPQLVPNVTVIRGTDVGELRAAVDALRYALFLPARFSGAGAATGMIRAADFDALVEALNGTRAATGAAPFAYAGVPDPEPNGRIHDEHIQQLREALR